LKTLILTQHDNEIIDSLLSKLIVNYSSPSETKFLLNARIYANYLPESILYVLNNFRYDDNDDGVLLLKGVDIDDEKIGKTPSYTGKDKDENSAIRESFFLILLSSFIGYPIGWKSQRDGALINSIIPLRESMNEQLSTGCIDLNWHTEEAFHQFRADYLCLMCLRNKDKVPTTIGSIKNIKIKDSIKKILFENNFIFLKDNNFVTTDTSEILEPIMFGDFNSPYIKIDPSFMKVEAGNDRAKSALEIVIKEIQKNLQEVVLNKGDVLFIDNYRVVHGRKAYTPRFDGTDRWLKRVNIAIDLRKSRALRETSNFHVIATQ